MSNNFVFLITCFNETEGIKKTLKTLNAQSYSNWRAIIRNDMSTDNTYDSTLKYISQNKDLDEKVLLIDNTRKFGEVENTLDSLHLINDDEIVCRIDAGDWLVDNDTLYFLNSIYAENKDLDVAWTSHRWGFTSQNISGPMPIEWDVYKHPWVSSHMKTFRKSCFNDIPESNFKDENNEFIMIACDQAIFLPLLHKTNLRKRKYGHIPFVSYHYNIKTNDPSIYQTERALRQKDTAINIRKRGYLEY